MYRLYVLVWPISYGNRNYEVHRMLGNIETTFFQNVGFINTVVGLWYNFVQAIPSVLCLSVFTHLDCNCP